MPVTQKQTQYTFVNYKPEHTLFLKNTEQNKTVSYSYKAEVPYDKNRCDYDETLEGKAVSEEDYWKYYYEDTPYEWSNGILEVKPLSDFESNLMKRWFNGLVDQYLLVEKEIQPVSDEIGFKMIISSGSHIRKPDLAFIANDNLKMKNDDRTYKGTFDLCIEFLSDSAKSEVLRDIVKKKQEYEQAGVKEYFILDRKRKHTHFYRLENGKYKELNPTDGIIKSEVLKNFQFRKDDLYSRPLLHDLIEDPVYKGFVQVEYQKAKVEKNKAEIRALNAEVQKEKAEIKALKAENAKNKVKAQLLEYKKILKKLGYNHIRGIA